MKGKFVAGDAIMISTRFQQNPFNPSYIDMKIEDVQNLDKVQGNIANAVRLTLDSRYNDEKFFTSLKEFESKSDTDRKGDLYLRLLDCERKQYITIHSRKKYRIDKELMSFLEAWGIRRDITTRHDH